MRVALDATYSVDARPSGIGVYSRELLRDLPLLYPDDRFIACVRPKRWLAMQRNRMHLPNVRVRLLHSAMPTGRAEVFHALNQRLDWRPARRVVTTFHDLFVLTAEYSTAEFRERFARKARQAAERSDLIIAVSQFTARQVEEHLGVERQRIRVVYHGVHQCAIDMPVKREPTILFLGTLQARKNVIRLVEAFESTPREWRLVIAGSTNGFGAEAALSRIRESRRANDITITGYVDEPERQRWLAKASVFAFPSLDEGFGMPVLEAMRWGVPVVTSDRSATREVAGGAAVLVDPLSAESIADGLLRVIRDESLRNDLVQRGAERAAQYPWSRATKETYRVYQELVSR